MNEVEIVKLKWSIPTGAHLGIELSFSNCVEVNYEWFDHMLTPKELRADYYQKWRELAYEALQKDLIYRKGIPLPDMSELLSYGYNPSAMADDFQRVMPIGLECIARSIEDDEYFWQDVVAYKNKLMLDAAGCPWFPSGDKGVVFTHLLGPASFIMLSFSNIIRSSVVGYMGKVLAYVQAERHSIDGDKIPPMLVVIDGVEQPYLEIYNPDNLCERLGLQVYSDFLITYNTSKTSVR